MELMNPEGKPLLGGLLWGGALVGGLTALLNGAYFMGYRAITDIRVEMPTLGSITAASVLPSVLAAVGYYALSR
jgi:hypothetical protein